MFWKKRNNGEGIKSILPGSFKKEAVPDSELFELKTKDRRGSYRVIPSKEEPILFRLEDRTVVVRDISATGLSFKNTGCAEGEHLTVDIDLPGLGPAIPATLRVIQIDPHHRCHCTFIRIDEGARERIHRYVLNRQKEQVRELRKLEKKNKSTVIRITTEPDKNSGGFP